MSQSPPNAPLDPMQPLTPRQPNQPMLPLARLVPMQPLAPLRPGERRPVAPARQDPARVDVQAAAPTYRPALAYTPPARVATLPPPPQQPQVINLGLSQSPPLPNWGGIPRPRVPTPVRRPRANKAGGWVAGIVAVIIAMTAGGIFKSSSSGVPDASTPSISVSVPPLSSGGQPSPKHGTSGHSGGSHNGATQPHQSGRTLDLNGGINGQRIRVSFLRLVNNATPKDTFMDAPGSGKRLVAAQFRVQNIGSFIYVASATSVAHVIDTKGHTYDAQFLFDSLREGKAFNGAISVDTGKSTVGFIAFEVPDNARIKKVEFSASSGGGQTGTWTFVRS